MSLCKDVYVDLAMLVVGALAVAAVIAAIAYLASP
jgi:hypothetical protein